MFHICACDSAFILHTSTYVQTLKFAIITHSWLPFSTTDVSAKDERSRTPFMLATMNKHEEVLKYMYVFCHYRYGWSQQLQPF